MINQKMTDALNEQINKELYSAYMYFAMSSYAGRQGLKGTASWFQVQAREEVSHALKIYQYVNSQGAHAVMKALAEPPAEYNGIVDLFEKTLEHERLVTQSIHDLVRLARQENDPATEIMLQWFVTEQIEEEETVNEILDELKLAGEGSGLFMVDRSLGERTVTSPDAP